MYGLFGPYGAWGVLLVLFLVFFIDAVLFPTLPELFFILAFTYDPQPLWGLGVLVTASLAEVAGVSLLYYVVDRIHVPQRIRNIAGRYASFLMVNDERMLLVNRIAPMIPFAGAFISLVDTWTLRRGLEYIILGCFLKYGAIMLMSSFFYAFFSGNDAQAYTFVFIFAVMIISIIISVRKKKKSGLSNEDS